jgi:hypothetical protein
MGGRSARAREGSAGTADDGGEVGVAAGDAAGVVDVRGRVMGAGLPLLPVAGAQLPPHPRARAQPRGAAARAEHRHYRGGRSATAPRDSTRTSPDESTVSALLFIFRLNIF